ncbi:MAG: type I restriction-modification system subunit M [Candidatus Zixiibacteriota bacterium]
MALKKSHIYSSLWQSCDQLRGGMDASLYKDYILTLLFVKYVSDKYKGQKYGAIKIPENGSFDDIVKLKGANNIGDEMNKVIKKLAEKNDLRSVLDTDFNDDEKLGRGKDKVDRLTKLVGIFEKIDFRANRAQGDDLLGDAYEYLMRNFATQSGKSKGQFYTPAEVSRIMAKVIGMRNAKDITQPTLYDPLCGSGSLLIKAANEADVKTLAIYGQENDVATWRVSRMNMILHDHASADIWRGNTLTEPHFHQNDNDEKLKTFDFAVANPPFSQKNWTNGLNPENDEFGRFEYGIPPSKNGDYAFLLHFIKSLKSTGKGAVILPHGVLFRGNREANIRKNLLKRGLIKGIIGLPANLFYGTGIPACIIIIDKQNSASRKGIFMIDASKGFIKDGNKNRLREQDIFKIVEVFNEQIEADGYSRMVPIAEIASETNDYNLNIPRYIDSSEEEDQHDLQAHLSGGIPDYDIESLSEYWKVFPNLRNTLFENIAREGYSKIKVESQKIKQAILEHQDFKKYHDKLDAVYDKWHKNNSEKLGNIKLDDKPQMIIDELADGLVIFYIDIPLLSKYDIYQVLMDYWNEDMEDDVFLISADGMDYWNEDMHQISANGWESGKILRAPEDKETPHFSIKKGRKTVKLVGEIIYPKHIIDRFFNDEYHKVNQLEDEISSLSQKIEEFEEEHSDDGGALDGLEGTRGISKTNVLDRVMEIKDELMKVFLPKSDKYKIASSIKKTSFETMDWEKGIEDEEGYFEELDILHQYLNLLADEKDKKKNHKKAEAQLYKQVAEKYSKLTIEEIEEIIIEDKWFTDIKTGIDSQLQSIIQRLSARIKELDERYKQPLPEIEKEISQLNKKVKKHLEKMGLALDD